MNGGQVTPPGAEQDARVLVAGIGNVFAGDDGFGVEVALRLRERDLPGWVRVGDFGVGGLHLAYELLEGYRTTVLVDALPRGGTPGTVYLLEPDPGDGSLLAGRPDGHGMDPLSVLALVDRMGGDPGRLLLVGCEPADLGARLGLSPAVGAAVDEAVGMIMDLIASEAAAAAPGAANRSGTEGEP